MAYTKTVILATVLSLLLIASVSESRLTGFQFGASAPVLVCARVYGAEQDDNCSSVSHKFKLSEAAFLKINPNINCEKVFVGQWLCVDA